jgi:hypothetical protein
MDTNHDSLTPRLAASESSSHFTFSPLVHQKLSMRSDEGDSSSDFEGGADSEIDTKQDTCSRKHEWEKLSKANCCEQICRVL